ncbi:putative defense protein Hdd11 isoform X2 [Lineus longissimus]
MSDSIIFVATCFFLARGGATYSHGTPDSACRTMLPGHGVEPQTSSSPYTIFVTADTYHPEKPLKVILFAIGSTAEFSGFLLQARQVNSERICGSFLIPDHAADIQHRTCQRRDDTVTHSKCFRAKNVEVIWYPPLHNYGLIKFHATIVFNKTTFWSQIESSQALKPDQDFMHYSGLEDNATYPHNHSAPWVWSDE